MGYNTNQRKLLHDFFAGHVDQSFSAQELAAFFYGTVSLSAIYRNLAELSKSGEIKREVKKESREAVYQLSSHGECKDDIHLSCTECGKVFHLKKNLADEMQKSLSRSNGFKINKSISVLYGTCKTCRNGADKHSAATADEKKVRGA